MAAVDVETPGGRAPFPFGVYVHVPFCRHRCDYCAFATWTGREQIWEQYVAACATEVTRFGTGLISLAGKTGRGPATSVFFGGGTPSLLPAELLVAVLGAVSECIGLAAGAEVTVECNPETVTSEKLAAYRAGGVTRLSFGVQSMVPHVLAALGREHEPGSVRRAAYLAGEAGFAGAYNADLIFGAAGETMSDWEASLEGVLALDPPPAHVSAYALTVEPGTPLATQRERHPSEDDQADKYAVACSWLGSAGFEWYEIRTGHGRALVAPTIFSTGRRANTWALGVPRTPTWFSPMAALGVGGMCAHQSATADWWRRASQSKRPARRWMATSVAGRAWLSACAPRGACRPVPCRASSSMRASQSYVKAAGLAAGQAMRKGSAPRAWRKSGRGSGRYSRREVVFSPTR